MESRTDVTGVVSAVRPDWTYPIEVRWDHEKSVYKSRLELELIRSRGYAITSLRIIPAVDRLAGLVDD